MRSNTPPAQPTRRSVLQVLSALGATAYGAAWSQAQTAGYPTRPAKLLVPNAPGSSVDTISRLVAAGGRICGLRQGARRQAEHGVCWARVGQPPGWCGPGVGCGV